ncbi:hypothetical protein DPEC_G00073130 [Dallia pectoralis]|uniref:Uncharacterized protein n=1 Tax=Dallia pectoralis TaxID=75939 RepID=A0ACC2H2K3_DALPE|nr:hypothetical protein DPEC_G00073130 [Dallia pectoralis]
MNEHESDGEKELNGDTSKHCSPVSERQHIHVGLSDKASETSERPHHGNNETGEGQTALFDWNKLFAMPPERLSAENVITAVPRRGKPRSGPLLGVTVTSTCSSSLSTVPWL